MLLVCELHSYFMNLEYYGHESLFRNTESTPVTSMNSHRDEKAQLLEREGAMEREATKDWEAQQKIADLLAKSCKQEDAGMAIPTCELGEIQDSGFLRESRGGFPATPGRILERYNAIASHKWPSTEESEAMECLFSLDRRWILLWRLGGVGRELASSLMLRVTWTEKEGLVHERS